MPRKQRFKPSRKPKAVGTATDLAPVTGADSAGATPGAVTPRESAPEAVTPEDRVHHDAGEFTPANELGREPG
jgi:hypothetical protein